MYHRLHCEQEYPANDQQQRNYNVSSLPAKLFLICCSCWDPQKKLSAALMFIRILTAREREEEVIIVSAALKGDRCVRTPRHSVLFTHPTGTKKTWSSTWSPWRWRNACTYNTAWHAVITPDTLDFNCQVNNQNLNKSQVVSCLEKKNRRTEAETEIVFS